MVLQEFTFTVSEDTNIQITYPSEALQTRCWTMHVIVNAGNEDERHAWVDLVCKGTSLSVMESSHIDIDRPIYVHQLSVISTRPLEAHRRKSKSYGQNMGGKG